MDIVVIGGKSYNVLVLEIVESFNILYGNNTGRVIAAGAPMVLDPLGTFIGHKVKFARKKGHEAEYDALFDYLAVPRYDGIPVRIVHGQSSISYDAYVSQGERAVKRIDEKTGLVHWDKFTANIIPMEAQILPL